MSIICVQCSSSYQISSTSTKTIFWPGSDHVREKDGVWAALCWLQVRSTFWRSLSQIGFLYLRVIFLFHFDSHPPCSFQILAAKRCSVEQLLTSHWNKVSSTHHFSIQNCHVRNIIISLPSSNIIIMFNKSSSNFSTVATFSPGMTMRDVLRLPVNR